MKKLVLFTLAYFVITMAWAYPWHVVWFEYLYQELGAVTRSQPVIYLGMISVVIQGIVIGYFYPFFYKGVGNPILQGIKFNMIIGLLIYSAMGFATAAKIHIEPVSQFLIYHTIFQAIQFILTGTALGLIYKGNAN